MPRIISENEKRAKRQAVVVAKNVQTFIRNGVQPDVAQRLATNNDAIRRYNALQRAAVAAQVAVALGKAPQELVELVQRAEDAVLAIKSVTHKRCACAVCGFYTTDPTGVCANCR